MAAEDVEVVMDSAAMLEDIGDELARVIRNRDRLMRNRNNKQRELTELRHKMGELHRLLRKYDDSTEIPKAALARVLDSSVS